MRDPPPQPMHQSTADFKPALTGQPDWDLGSQGSRKRGRTRVEVLMQKLRTWLLKPGRSVKKGALETKFYHPRCQYITRATSRIWEWSWWNDLPAILTSVCARLIYTITLKSPCWGIDMPLYSSAWPHCWPLGKRNASIVLQHIASFFKLHYTEKVSHKIACLVLAERIWLHLQY